MALAVRFLVVSLGLCAALALALGSAPTSSVIERMKQQVASHEHDAEELIKVVTRGPLRHLAYHRLANFTDLVGNRLCGSQNYDNAVDYMLDQLAADGLDNVHGELVTTPAWSRGDASCTMLTPKYYPMNILALGTSIGTPPQGIVAQVVVVRSFDDLKLVNATGKIVVFNQQCDWAAEPVDCYGETVGYRTGGAVVAAQAGAVAVLIRSVAAFSINSPHTGVQHYEEGVRQIPTACITVEDAESLQRLYDNKLEIVISLTLTCSNLENVTAMNVVADITGSEKPEEIVLVSGHLDSWDVGVGAMDDGGGAFISWNVLKMLRSLGMRAKRTIRLVMWACEEFGGIGAQQYYDQHKSNVSNYDLVMESDLGVFLPYGIQFTGSHDAFQVMQSVGQLLTSINGSLVTSGGEGTDIEPWMNAGVPGASLANDNVRYFWYHHSGGDQMDVLDPDDLDLASAIWAVTAFTVADLDDMLPRS